MLSKKGLIMLTTIFTLGVSMLPVHAAELADQNPPNATEESYIPFHPNLEEDSYIIETDADKEAENQMVFEEVVLNETTFPDEGFRSFVASKCDTNSDGTLQSDEIRNAKILDTEFEAYFSSTQGIEYLKNLKKFAAPMADITSIDISNNPKLQILDVNYNENLASLNVSNNKELRILDISTTKIKNIDVSNNPELRWLFCFDAPISSVDVSNNAKLKRLDCARTPLTSIDISNNPRLQALNIEETKVSSIDTSKNRDLYEFYFKGTSIASVDFTKNWNLAQIWASDTKLTSLDVSHCRNLFVLYVQNLAIKEIDFSNCPNFYELFASNSSLEKLDVSNHPFLNCIEIDGTNIDKLDIGKSKAINGLNISNTKIKELDLSNNTELKRLEVKGTAISNLDLSNITALEKFNMENTNIQNLKNLDLSKYTTLKELNCKNAGIESLVLPDSPELYQLVCSENHLKSIDLSKAPSLWLGLEHSPQTIKAAASKKEGTVVVDMKQLVSDLSKVTFEDSEHYTFDKETGLLTFKDANHLNFAYSYAHGYQHDASDTTMSVQAKAVLTYAVLEGMNQKIESNQNFIFKCEGTKEKFESISINGTPLSENDYTVKEDGETLVFEIQKEFLNKLPSAVHQIVVTFQDGEASLSFEKVEAVVVPPTGGQDGEDHNTPDRFPIIDSKPSTDDRFPIVDSKPSTDNNQPAGNGTSTSKPNASTTETIKTGDSNAVLPWMFACMISFAVIAGLFSKKAFRR